MISLFPPRTIGICIISVTYKKQKSNETKKTHEFNREFLLFSSFYADPLLPWKTSIITSIECICLHSLVVPFFELSHPESALSIELACSIETWFYKIFNIIGSFIHFLYEIFTISMCLFWSTWVWKLQKKKNRLNILWNLRFFSFIDIFLQSSEKYIKWKSSVASIPLQVVEQAQNKRCFVRPKLSPVQQRWKINW